MRNEINSTRVNSILLKTFRKKNTKLYTILNVKLFSFCKKYQTFKSSFFPKRVIRASKTTANFFKRIKRSNYKQYKYIHVFWRKLQNFFSSKQFFKKKNFFWNKNKKKNHVTLFSNKLSLYALLIPSLFYNCFTLTSKPPFFIKGQSYLVRCLLIGYTFLEPRMNLTQRVSSKFLKFVPNIFYPKDSFYSKFSFKNSHIYSRHNQPFILHLNGITLPYKFKFKFNLKRSYAIKKVFYSFLRTNELKKSVLNSKKKLVFTKLIHLVKANQLLFRRLVHSKNNIIHLFRNNIKAHKLNSSTYISDKLNPLTNALVYNKNISVSNELRIPRIRFKPGYQRL
jgi:hypothetical protein